jgi:RNA polymerase sigma-70 factor, ECF subfamily
MGSHPGLHLPLPFDEVIDRHEREIMRYLLHATGNRDDALDLFQETWLRAYRAYPQLNSSDGILPWLFRIATNLCRNRIRDNFRRSRVIGSPGEASLVAASADGRRAGTSDNLIHIRRMIAALPEKQRTALMLRKFGGLDYREIAAALGCSLESARADVYQAIRKLKAAL